MTNFCSKVFPVLFFIPYERINYPFLGIYIIKILKKYILLLFLLIKSNPIRQHSKVLYRYEVRRRGKTGKHRKVGVESSGFKLNLPIPHNETGGSTQGETMEPGG